MPMLRCSLDGNLGFKAMLKVGLDRRISPRVSPTCPRLLRLGGVQIRHRHDFLGASHRQALGDNTIGKLVHLLRFTQTKQCTRVAGGKNARGDLLLHRCRQIQQSQGIRNLRTRL